MEHQTNSAATLSIVPAKPANKTSFLVHKQNKYLLVPVENIAFFRIRFEASMIMCLDGQEYFVNHSLEHLQGLVTQKQFYRLNRQYLINVTAIKEAEHYFARKLKVILTVAVSETLLVPKDKVSSFLGWLDNR